MTGERGLEALLPAEAVSSVERCHVVIPGFVFSLKEKKTHDFGSTINNIAQHMKNSQKDDGAVSRMP